MSPDSLPQLLCNAANNGVYHLPTSGREAMGKAAAEAGLCYHLCQLEDSEEADEVLELLGDGLQLPEWYGKNFDALYDCLTDLTWQETASTVVVLTGCDAIHAADPETWQTLISVFASAAEFWRDAEVPFWVFIDMSADGLACLPAIA
jgi:RNAse (barnase) inhibitor barstar